MPCTRNRSPFNCDTICPQSSGILAGVAAAVTVVVVVSPPTPLVRVMGLVKFGAELPEIVWGTEVVLKTAGGGLSDVLIERDCAGRGCVGREVAGTVNVDMEA